MQIQVMNKKILSFFNETILDVTQNQIHKSVLLS